ncbi:Disintegrin and metalloproteinase domain-containing protein 12 [Lemmus lemmus]
MPFVQLGKIKERIDGMDRLDVQREGSRGGLDKGKEYKGDIRARSPIFQFCHSGPWYLESKKVPNKKIKVFPSSSPPPPSPSKSVLTAPAFLSAGYTDDEHQAVGKVKASAFQLTSCLSIFQDHPDVLTVQLQLESRELILSLERNEPSTPLHGALPRGSPLSRSRMVSEKTLSSPPPRDVISPSESQSCPGTCLGVGRSFSILLHIAVQEADAPL